MRSITSPRAVSMTMGMSLLLADGAAQLEAVHLGQHHVQDGGVEAALGSLAQPRQAFAGPRGAAPAAARSAGNRPPAAGQLFVVVDEQDAVHGPPARRRRRVR
jgi:hypothetical protein